MWLSCLIEDFKRFSLELSPINLPINSDLHTFNYQKNAYPQHDAAITSEGFTEKLDFDCAQESTQLPNLVTCWSNWFHWILFRGIRLKGTDWKYKPHISVNIFQNYSKFTFHLTIMQHFVSEYLIKIHSNLCLCSQKKNTTKSHQNVKNIWTNWIFQF